MMQQLCQSLLTPSPSPRQAHAHLHRQHRVALKGVVKETLLPPFKMHATITHQGFTNGKTKHVFAVREVSSVQGTKLRSLLALSCCCRLSSLAWMGTPEAFSHPCKALHLVNTKGHSTCNPASPAPVLITIPSLPPAVRGRGSWAWGGVSSIHSPPAFAHPGASEMIPFQCPVRAGPEGRAWCFWNCSSHTGRQRLGYFFPPILSHALLAPALH